MRKREEAMKADELKRQGMQYAEKYEEESDRDWVVVQEKMRASKSLNR